MTRRFLLISFFALAFTARLAAADPAYRVIVNSSNPVTSVSKAVLSKMLLKTQTEWSNGNRVMPVDQKATSKVRDTISRAVHGRSAMAIKTWWNQQIFAGKGVPPPELISDAKVIAYVSANAGAIGYVSTETNTSDVKVVAVTE